MNGAQVRLTNRLLVRQLAFPCEQGTGRIDKEFDLTDCVWDESKPAFDAWLAAPKIQRPA